jgi:hypothetical protein
MPNPVSNISYTFWVGILISILNSVPNISYTFSVAVVIHHPIVQYFTRNLHAESSTLYILTEQCNLSPNYPIFHISMLNSVPDILSTFSMDDEICYPLVKYLTGNLHAESSAQYFIYIFSGRCNSLPNFPIFHQKSPSWFQHLTIWYAFLVGDLIPWPYLSIHLHITIAAFPSRHIILHPPISPN